MVQGSVSGGTVPGWLQARHIVGRLNVERAEPIGSAHLLATAANGLRRVLAGGARVLDSEQRALFTGLVIGDDRNQSLETTDDFRGAGLSHLLAVSGQNVAFVLAAAAPLSSRMGLRARLVWTVALLVLFATVTRFEPSVLRATVMAGLACTATTIGRPVPALRILAIAVCGLLLVDPFLVRSVGFGLSVAASTGIVVLREPIARVLPGPPGLANALAVIIAAQLGVAPLLIMVFGGLPVAALPANLAAEPVAGFVMIWGASAGLLAGVVPVPVAEMIHLPTSFAIWWIASIARWTTDARLGELGLTTLVPAVVVGLSAAWFRSRSPLLTRVGMVVLLVVLAAPAVTIRLPVDRTRELVGVGTLSSAGGEGELDVLSVSNGARAADALRALRRAGVTRLDRARPADVGLDHGRGGHGDRSKDRRGAGRRPAERASVTTSAGRTAGVASPPVELALGEQRFDVTHRAVIMGILNRTPDSFFDQGAYFGFDDFLRKAEMLVAEGADLLDVGGVKAGPGPEVTEAEELERTVPAVAALRDRFDVPLSIDTWRASVAAACFEAGATVGNDISGFADPSTCRCARLRERPSWPRTSGWRRESPTPTRSTTTSWRRSSTSWPTAVGAPRTQAFLVNESLSMQVWI